MRDFFSSAWDVLFRAFGAAAGMLTGWPMGIKALCALMAADYVTGVLTAIVKKSPKSKTGGLSARASFEGLLRKGLMFLVILIAALADRYTGASSVLQNMTIGFYLFNESLSVLENVALLGVPIPAPLKSTLDALKKRDADVPEQRMEPAAKA